MSKNNLSELFSLIPEINETLFQKYGIIITNIRRDQTSADFSLMSCCGTASMEVPLDLWESDNWVEMLLQIVATKAEVLFDISFGSFSKSQLFYKLNTDIFLPTQQRAPLEISASLDKDKNWKEIDCIGIPIFLTNIAHDYQAGTPVIKYIRGEIPACDEFHIWDDEVSSFQNPEAFSLDQIVESIVERLQELSPDFEIVYEKSQTEMPLLRKERDLLALINSFGIRITSGICCE